MTSAFQQIPQALTSEEENLMKKYNLLKQKKKDYEALVIAKQAEQQNLGKGKMKLGGDAKEAVKNLVKSGAIKLGPSSESKDKVFKRSMNLKKRPSELEKPTSPGYQPFEETYESFNKRSRMHSDGYVPHRSPSRSGSGDSEGDQAPKRGNTIYIRGREGIQEDFLTELFSPFGPIHSVQVERSTRGGFIVFEKIEHAEEAITKMNGKYTHNMKLEVSVARVQKALPQVTSPQAQLAEGKTGWSRIAVSQEKKSNREDSRDLVTYDGPFD